MKSRIVFLYAAGYEKSEIRKMLNVDIESINSCIAEFLAENKLKNGREIAKFIATSSENGAVTIKNTRL